MIPLSKPSIDKKELKYIQNIFKSKILTDGYFQNQVENRIKN